MGEEKEIETLESPKEEPFIDFAGKKRRILTGLLGWPAFVGVTTSFLFDSPDFTALTVITLLPVLILAILWCRTDAAEREQQIVDGPHGWRTFMSVPLALFFIAGMIVIFVGASFAGMFLRSVLWTAGPIL